MSGPRSTPSSSSSSSPPLPSSSSNEEFLLDTSLPMDMIINILSRLPVKSLCKFKCVSKKWLELITDTRFVSTHREMCLSNPNKLLLKITYMRKCIKVDFCALSIDEFCKDHEFSMFINNINNEFGYIKMLPSKGGLICFMSDTGFYACNPSTQVMVKLPEFGYCPTYFSRVSAGMGYIKERDEYVLVHLYDRNEDEHFAILGCEVLRLRDGMDCSLKVVDVDCPYVVGWGVLVEDVFYWINWDEVNQEGNEHAVVSFDLGKEEFSTLPPPRVCFDDLYCSWSLVELGGRLCLVGNAAKLPTMNIWVLNDIENHQWVLEYRIPMDGCHDILKSVVPLDYRDGKILIDAKRETLFYYDTKKKKKKKYIKRMDHVMAGKWDSLRLYTESFFSFNKIDT